MKALPSDEEREAAEDWERVKAERDHAVRERDEAREEVAQLANSRDAADFHYARAEKAEACVKRLEEALGESKKAIDAVMSAIAITPGAKHVKELMEAVVDCHAAREQAREALAPAEGAK